MLMISMWFIILWFLLPIKFKPPQLVKTHKMKKSLIILFLFVVGISNAQNIKVQGIVTDSLRTAIEMANIMAVNLDLDKMDGYSITGEKGQYALNLKPNSNYQLKVSYLGFRDRKSTRLNSSHVRISYAVFCLKKKKQLITQLQH